MVHRFSAARLRIALAACVLALTAGAAVPAASAAIGRPPGARQQQTLDATVLAATATVLHENGAWCWFEDPRAVYFQGRFKRTYVGFIDNTGNIIVSMYDHTSTRRTTSVLRTGFAVDDHNSPAILVRPNGSLLVFWSAHAGSTMYYRRSLHPEDVSAWGPVQTVPTNTPGSLGYTYPNPVQLSAEGNKIYLFWRGGNFNPTYATANDSVPWTPARTLISVPGQRPYLKVASNGKDTIHFAFTEAHPRGTVTSIYYIYYRAGSLYRADGTRIGRLADGPVTPSQATKVYDASTTGVGAWVHDIAVDSTGRPVITFATFPSPDDHRYQYARWTGTRWMTKELTRAGGSISTDPVEYQYSGGITLDHDNPSVVYLSRPINGVHEIERWATADGGATWTRTAITARSTQPNVRPVSPWGLPNDGPMNVVWMAGNYGTYTTFQTRIMRTGGNPENQAPTARYTASPRTGVAPLTVAFDGRRSTDPEGPVVAWTWDFGDGTSASGPTVSHTYTRPGTYPVALRVTDSHTPNPGNDVLVKEVVVTG